jgi:hypothetical protein
MKIKSALLITVITICSTKTIAGDFPKAPIQREIDKMGSLLDGDGAVFKPTKKKSDSTKATIGNVNKYLFQATIDVLKFAPLASTDSNAGIIITEWYSPRDQTTTQFKVTVRIKDKLIAPEALEVIAFQRKKIKGVWSDNYEPSPIAIVLEDKILCKARQLYQDSKKSK